jgi:hypothetical protein
MNRALELIGKAQGVFTDPGARLDTNIIVKMNMPEKVPIDKDALPVIDIDAE